MANATWKEAERRAARAIGGRRVGPTGRDGPDVDGGWIVAEVKHRARLPGWLALALARIRQQAGPSRLGVVVAHAAGARDAETWVILSLADWRAWFGDLRTDGQDPAAESDQNPTKIRPS